MLGFSEMLHQMLIRLEARSSCCLCRCRRRRIDMARGVGAARRLHKNGLVMSPGGK